MSSTNRPKGKHRKRTGSVTRYPHRNHETGKTETLVALGGSNRYFIQSKLGGGSFGSVYLCFDAKIKTSVCVKEQPCRIKKYGDRAYHEAAVLRYCNERAATSTHVGARHIISLLDTYVDKDLGKHYMVMPYACRNDAFVFMSEYCKTSQAYVNLVHGFARDILVIVDFLHSIGVFHRDMKLENFLVFWDQQAGREVLKICDFGFAMFGGYDQSGVRPMGSALYAPPEILFLSFEKGSFKLAPADLWSAVTCIFCLVYEAFPFVGRDFDLQGGKHDRAVVVHVCNQMKAFLNCPTPFPPLKVFYNEKTQWCGFFESVFVDADKRPSIRKLMERAWVSELLLCDARRRIYMKRTDQISDALPASMLSFMTSNDKLMQESTSARQLGHSLQIQNNKRLSGSPSGSPILESSVPEYPRAYPIAAAASSSSSSTTTTTETLSVPESRRPKSRVSPRPETEKATIDQTGGFSRFKLNMKKLRRPKVRSSRTPNKLATSQAEDIPNQRRERSKKGRKVVTDPYR